MGRDYYINTGTITGVIIYSAEPQIGRCLIIHAWWVRRHAAVTWHLQNGLLLGKSYLELECWGKTTTK